MLYLRWVGKVQVGIDLAGNGLTGAIDIVRVEVEQGVFGQPHGHAGRQGKIEERPLAAGDWQVVKLREQGFKDVLAGAVVQVAVFVGFR